MNTNTIDITPTWVGLAPAYFAVLQNGNAEGRKIAREELLRMAQAADKWNAHAKEVVRNKKVAFTAKSTTEMAYMVAHIASLSCWFEVTPLPDDKYEIEVKRDVAHLAFPISAKG